MKEIKHVVSTEEYTGSFTVKVPKRANRCSLQMEASKVAGVAKEDASGYFAFSEKVLNEYLVAIDLVHVPSGMVINNRDDLEYFELESLIAMICGIVVGGEKLGKQIA